MNPFRSLVDLILELRNQVLHRYATDNPYTKEESIALATRLKALAADCRVAARRMGCTGEMNVIDNLLQATVELFNSPRLQRDPYSRANILDAAVPPVARLADDFDAESRRMSKRRTGRPKNTEKDSSTKVVAALSAHHGYGEDMSVTNYEPAKNRGLAEKYKLSRNALSRFLVAKLGKDGHKKYTIACRKLRIGAMLALWRREMPGRMADLLPEEYGRGEDD